MFFFRGLREALHSTPNQGLLSQTTLATAGGHRAISVHVEHESQICIKFPFYVPPIMLIFCFFNLSLALSFASISEVFFHLVGYGTPPQKSITLMPAPFADHVSLLRSPPLLHSHTHTQHVQSCWSSTPVHWCPYINTIHPRAPKNTPVPIPLCLTCHCHCPHTWLWCLAS